MSYDKSIVKSCLRHLESIRMRCVWSKPQATTFTYKPTLNHTLTQRKFERYVQSSVTTVLLFKLINESEISL